MSHVSIVPNVLLGGHGKTAMQLELPLQGP